ncbi:Protein TRANSPARENT TESTA 12 [Morus notabilis]|uniref:Protein DETOXIFICATION n=1 Tax=Morus notabilis TaxID=981085 RepID=W9R7X9_9ROSA|nr:Protein TRANSPARENT TESTA 12 [Morus notabilis]
MGSSNRNEDGDLNQALIAESSTKEDNGGQDFSSRLCIESKKLWHVVGPAIFSRVASYSMNIITQAFAGHLSEVELASISIANTVIVGFNFGLLLGMVSALETLCGQAFGAKRYHMLGIYLQRSWIVLFLCCFLTLPFYIFTTPVLKLLGQSDAVSEQSGLVALWLIPLHFSFAFHFPLQRFLQFQLQNQIIAWVSLMGLAVNALTSWLLVYVFDFGVVGAAIALDISWWFMVLGLFVYTSCGWCPLTWTGFSVQAFVGLWDFVKLSVASGVMLCLENWYYRILLLMTGYLKNATTAVDALSVCTTIKDWEMMIPMAFFDGTGVRVANELGAGNGNAVTFATKVNFGGAIHRVAVGSGWQAWVAYINLGCYYIIGLPLEILMGWIFKLGVMGIWGGMILGGTAAQTVILAITTIRCDWEKEGIWGGIILGGTAVQTVIITIRCDWEKERKPARGYRSGQSLIQRITQRTDIS